MAAAESCQASTLVEALNEFKSKNSAIWNELVGEGHADDA